STSTIVLFRMSLMKVLAHATALRAMRCLSFVEMQFKSSIGNPQSEMKVAASPGFAPGPPVSETGALLIMQRGNGRPGGNCSPNICLYDRHHPVSPPGGHWLR